MKRISALLLIVGHCLAGVGQDTHYWTQAFGTRAALLGGSVVGGTKDNTALYYNLSLLAFIDTASVSINANLYQFENIRIENAIGQRADFKSNRIATIPLLVTGMFKSKNNRWKIGYGFFAPVNFECKATARIDDKVQIVDDTESPGEEDFIGQKSVSSTLKEISLAIGVGYRAGERFAIGITPCSPCAQPTTSNPRYRDFTSTMQPDSWLRLLYCKAQTTTMLGLPRAWAPRTNGIR